MPLSIGYDIGSSSIKCAILDPQKGCIASGSSPEDELPIDSPKPGWAEQDPETWWAHLKRATAQALKSGSVDARSIRSIGISYQMHGLVLLDRDGKVLRPSIIWCDSRAVEIGRTAFDRLGHDFCLEHLLNAPGNFTASKLRWVKEHEPDIYRKVHKAMLPGDYIAYKLTGEISSTVSGLSEGVFWDFQRRAVSKELLDQYEIESSLLPELHPTFSVQGRIAQRAAEELGFDGHTVVSYRAGDQPNNALSLNVLQPGEIAATAGTSGVVYGVIDQLRFDRLSRVNQFVHVNNSNELRRIGVLLCINGTGILNSWLRRNAATGLSYEEMNRRAAEIPMGSEGLSVLPFGNGAERVLENKSVGARILGLDFNRHSLGHVLRAGQEGIAFALKYGMNIIEELGMSISVIRAGKANMFLSPVFRKVFSAVTGSAIELYDTDGAQGAARGAAIGSGETTIREAFQALRATEVIQAELREMDEAKRAYDIWLRRLNETLSESFLG